MIGVCHGDKLYPCIRKWEGFFCALFSALEGGLFSATSPCMKQVLIIGASGGVGAALAAAYEGRGDTVTRLSRSVDGFDITDERSVDQHLTALNGPFDVVLVATGALEIDGAAPEKTIKSISQKAMLDQFALNAVGPALVLRHAGDLLRRDAPCVFAVFSARVGSIGDNRIGGWISYRSAKAAVKTAFTAKYLARHPAVAPSEAAENLLAVIDGLTPADTGQFFDWAGKPVPW
jgi:NAD(P)-dependent dehydrogenase (short-subunit alcohol dehydrogenase family)